MSLPEHAIPWPPDESPEQLLAREWLATNGLGGYAAGSVAGVCTRRYHGLLVAALPAPQGRVVMLSQLAESLQLADGGMARLTGEELAGGPCELPDVLAGFWLDQGLPVWRFQHGDTVLEKRVLMACGHNTTHVSYRLVAGSGEQRLVLRPRLNFRPHEADVSQPLARYEVAVHADGYEIRRPGDAQLPPLRLQVHGRQHTLVLDGGHESEFAYRVEAARGYAGTGPVWSPGRIEIALSPGEECTLAISTEPWDAVQALGPQQAREAERQRRERLLAQADPAAREGAAAELVLAADQFIISPGGRPGDGARAREEGDEARTVIAGYHWFTDWGRDTMISLEGLALVTGRHAEAGAILRTFLHYVKDGLIPNMFPEGQNDGLYHTADATLWFFHAMDRYVAASGDTATLRRALPAFASIIEHHLRGTRFHIGVDPQDGLLSQGAEGYQLTWMDAKVDGWVVTPRRGKAVELNALFYNALRLMQHWLQEHGDAQQARQMDAHAQRLRDSFNQRFWNARTGCLFDVVDGEQGDDPAIRPNMLLAVSLPHPVLDASRWKSVVDVALRLLVTPVGLRSLAPGHPDYQPRYDGDLRTRDAAYHQGTVWGWLAGPFVDAWLKVHPDDAAGVRHIVDGLVAHLRDGCIGSVSEIFDAEAPHTPRGCVAQAWSVAEALRILVKTSPAHHFGRMRSPGSTS
jgi:predicted glycogen debranching enzyme